jgi:peptidoglycan-N-acetylglucosamine deacetylase
MSLPALYLRRLQRFMWLPLSLGTLSALLVWADQPVWAAVVFFGGGVVFPWGTLRPASTLFGPGTCALPKPDGVLITLDDGPDPETTPALLAVLAQAQAKAVFFVIGQKAQAHPQLITAILKEGHWIANHSLTHPAGAFWSLGPWRMWRELAATEVVLAPYRQTYSRSVPHWFRPPVGHHNPCCHAAAHVLGLRLILWNCRGYDASDTSVSRVISRLKKSLQPGAIILLHDAQPHSAVVLGQALQLVATHGLRVITPEESGLDDAALVSLTLA